MKADNEIDTVQTLTKTTNTKNLRVLVRMDNYSQQVLVLSSDFSLFLKRGLWLLNFENSWKF